jgi:L-asparaginase
MKPEISLLSIGGTITMTGEGGSGVLPRLSAEDLLAAVPALAGIARLRPRTLFTLPSPHMEIETVVDIARAVEAEIAAGARGVVVTQGTDNIEESAFALELLLLPSAPVVVTGAMRNPTLPGSDGPANLTAAVKTAAAGPPAVFVVLDDRIHAPRFVHKAHTTSAAAFRSAPFQVGQITEDRMTLFAEPAPLPHIELHGKAQRPARVAILPSALGEDGRLIDSAVACGYQGLVVDAMGAGHVHPAMAERLEGAAGRMPVVMATRTGGGSTLAGTYAFKGGEIDLCRRGVLRAGWLPAPKARIALSLLIGAGADTAAIRRFFSAFDGG